jgi:hypothetical protein
VAVRRRLFIALSAAVAANALLAVTIHNARNFHYAAADRVPR